MKEFAVLDRVRKTITRYNMLPEGARVAVAVSGGADSVCLLHVLAALAPEYGIELSVAHFNHGWRGAESGADERFVADLARRMGLRFHRAGPAEPVHDNLEQSARRARRAFFANLIRHSGVDRIALGHTRDDQAETVLFRLLRGSGLTGLAGICPVTADGLVRPLIDVTRSEVEDFLRARGLDWREDSSNQSPRFARNRIRANLLPQLARDWNPSIREALAQLADLAHEEERYWRSSMDALAGRILERSKGSAEFRINAIAQLPLAVRRRFIRRVIAWVKGDLRGFEYGHIEQVLALLDRPQGDGRVLLPGAMEARRSFDWLRIAPRSSARPGVPVRAVAAPGAYETADGATLHFEIAAGPTSPGKTRQATGAKDATLRAAELSLDRLPARLELRGWKPGDAYRPEGQIQAHKLKEMFQRARVPSWRRPSWPIVSSGAKILWVKEFGVAAGFAAGQGAGPVLRIWETVALDTEGAAGHSGMNLLCGNFRLSR